MYPLILFNVLLCSSNVIVPPIDSTYYINNPIEIRWNSSEIDISNLIELKTFLRKLCIIMLVNVVQNYQVVKDN